MYHEKIYDILFDSHPHPMYICETDTLRFLDVNNAALRLYGLSRSEFLKMSAFDIRSPEEALRLRQFLAKGEKGRHGTWFEQTGTWNHLKKDGTPISVQIERTVVVWDKREAYLISVLDLTNHQHLERVAHQAEKLAAVGLLAAGVAHEINNPLAVIIGFAESVKRRLDPGNEFFLALQSIEREALRCKNLVQDLLSFSRDHKGGPSAQAPQPMVEGALSLVESQARVRSVEVRRDFATDLPEVWADRQQIQQVVINLCTNAIDAMPKGGTLTIGLHRESDQVELRVTDTGGGIPLDIQPHLFEPFFTTKGIGKGTGLGLSLASDIVKEHRGHLAFDTISGKGTAFYFSLPLTAAPVPALPQAA